MDIIKWSPFQELDSKERQIRRVFERSDSPRPSPRSRRLRDGERVRVEVDVPGYEEKEIEIEVFDHTLVVKGEQADGRAGGDRSFRLHERLEREFVRRFTLPAETDTEHVKARFVKGVSSCTRRRSRPRRRGRSPSRGPDRPGWAVGEPTAHPTSRDPSERPLQRIPGWFCVWR